MSVIEVDLSAAGNLMRALGQKAKKAVGDGMLSFALRARTMAYDSSINAVKASPNGTTGAFNTGFYVRSWKARREAYSGGWQVHIFNTAPYAGVIEYGRRAGARMPPRSAIAAWVTRKLRIPFPQADSVAFLIARSIKRRGLEPRRVITGPDIQDRLKAAMDDEITRALQNAWARP